MGQILIDQNLRQTKVSSLSRNFFNFVEQNFVREGISLKHLDALSDKNSSNKIDEILSWWWKLFPTKNFVRRIFVQMFEIA